MEHGTIVETLDMSRTEQKPKTEIAKLLVGNRFEALKGGVAYV